ncbi:myosin-11-like [Dendronephthya gigantea]|uniref:myosin-11-like n=1 Tax=Dendronephthya gigantea TaxID=151771 RepID=UPI001068E876|nr:myosin-11-like [Dendronephthya gigantea]XP_028396246.1 myosin-11-like [Dendronephthya gigantea]
MAMELVKASDLSAVVHKAIDNLHELATVVQTKKDFREDEYDASNIEIIIEALQEMDRDRLKLHEMLESETIKASSLRYQLHRMPTQIKDEVQDAVLAARDSNEAEIQRLKDNLSQINSSIEKLEARNKELLSENSRLEPERHEALNEHDTVVDLLNHKMADKASKQITLNETRDTLRETYKTIIQLEESIVQLKEDLTLEREEAVEEKERLQKAVEDTRTKVKEQKIANEEQRSEIESLQEDLVDSEAQLDARRKVIRRFETSKAKLESQVVQLSRELQKAIKSNSILTQEGMRVMKAHQDMLTKLGNTKAGLDHEYKKLEGTLTSAKTENTKLTLKKEAMDEDFEIISGQCEKLKEQVKELERRLRRTRDQLQSKSDECTRVKDENNELEDEINQLKESHQAMSEAFNKRIEELKAALKGERSERTSLQTKRDGVTKEAGEFKSEYSSYMVKMSDTIQSAKNEHSELTQKGDELQRTLREDEQEILSKQELLKNSKQSYIETQKKLRDELQKLQDSINKIEKDIEDKQRTVGDKTPAFEILEQEFEESSKNFSELKQSIVDLKNRKASLELSIKRTGKENEKTLKPEVHLQDELKKRRADALRIMTEQNEEVKNIEKENYFCCKKLSTVTKENERFREAIENMEKEIKLLEQLNEASGSRQADLEQQVSGYQADVLTARDEDLKLDKAFAERDIKILEDIKKLQDETKGRESKVDGIHVKLQHEISLLASFIDGVANLRPKETSAKTSS